MNKQSVTQENSRSTWQRPCADGANGDVDFFLEEGERIGEEDEQAPPSSCSRPGKCSVLQWSSRSPVLATGWEDGMICTWTEKEGQLRECSTKAAAMIGWSALLQAVAKATPFSLEISVGNSKNIGPDKLFPFSFLFLSVSRLVKP